MISVCGGTDIIMPLHEEPWLLKSIGMISLMHANPYVGAIDDDFIQEDDDVNPLCICGTLKYH